MNEEGNIEIIQEATPEAVEVVEEAADEEEEAEEEFDFTPVQVGLFEEENDDTVIFRRVINVLLERVESLNGDPSPVHFISTNDLC